jgi:hypothetical protein
VSLWCRDEFRIVLRPRQVAVARLRRILTRQGLRRHMHATWTVPCKTSAADKTPWSGALAALDTVLPEIAERRACATVILSNHFTRYAMVPWSDALSNETEELSYARHTFSELYGRDEGEWELRISPGMSGKPQLASAVDARLLASLREMFGQKQFNLRSVRPHLMVACNACQAVLRKQSAWLALVEHGNLCLALLQDGQLSWVRTMRTGDQWYKELPFLLNREALVANIEVPTDDVLLWAPDLQRTPVIAGGRWKIRNLQPAQMPSVAQEADGRFAMYMSD